MVDFKTITARMWGNRSKYAIPVLLVHNVRVRQKMYHTIHFIHLRQNLYSVSYDTERSSLMARLNPTTQTYNQLTRAYDFMNTALFEKKLPDCLITLQREYGAYGYYYPARFALDTDLKISTDESALNPQYFREEGRKDREVISTLVHEMAHLWQHHFGKPGRARYHNKEWSEKMKTIGLHPSNIGEPGGAEVGDQMSHYIVTGGSFAKAYEKLKKSGFALEWMEYPAHIIKLVQSGALAADKVDDFIADGEDYDSLDMALVAKALNLNEGEKPAKKAKKPDTSKVKQTCPICDLNAWAKKGAELVCGECNMLLIPERRDGYLEH